jgi:hypothetical protein
MKNKTVLAAAFAPRNATTLSYTPRAGVLNTTQGLLAYREAKQMPSGDLLGICHLSFENLTTDMEAQSGKRLPPWADRDRLDRSRLYGRLHCSTKLPNPLQQELLAECATRSGGVIPFEKAAKRRNRPHERKRG